MVILYRSILKEPARELRTNMTEAEKVIWDVIRKKKLFGVQFYRQKVVGPYIVDFYAPAVRLIIEVDGAHHLTKEKREQDQFRDKFLQELGLHVLRFSNSQVRNKLYEAVGKINYFIRESIRVNSPTLKKGVATASVKRAWRGDFNQKSSIIYQAPDASI